MTQIPGSAFDEGLRLLQAGDVQNAIAYLTQAVRQNPADGRAYGYLGIAQCRGGDLNGGLASLQEASRLQPNDSAAQYNLAVVLMQSQRTEEARGALQRALALDPNNAKAVAALNSLPAAAPPPVQQSWTPAPPPSAQPTWNPATPAPLGDWNAQNAAPAPSSYGSQAPLSPLPNPQSPAAPNAGVPPLSPLNAPYNPVQQLPYGAPPYGAAPGAQTAPPAPYGTQTPAYNQQQPAAPYGAPPAASYGGQPGYNPQQQSAPYGAPPGQAGQGMYYNPSTAQKQPSIAANLGAGIAVGVILALVCGAGFGFASIAVGFRIPYLTLLMGFIIGNVIPKVCGGRGHVQGILAAGCTVGAALIGQGIMMAYDVPVSAFSLVVIFFTCSYAYRKAS